MSIWPSPGSNAMTKQAGGREIVVVGGAAGKSCDRVAAGGWTRPLQLPILVHSRVFSSEKEVLG
jgi:hypothetical protein